MELVIKVVVILEDQLDLLKIICEFCAAWLVQGDNVIGNIISLP